MKILILGGTYFIGRHVAGHLAKCGHEVTLLNRGTRPAVHPTLHADRNDPRSMRSALAGRTFDLVLDTSCYDATQALIAEGALTGRYRRWIFLSSAAVYGDDAPRPLAERNAPVGSASFGSHGTKKGDAERVLGELCGERLTILRPGYVYGPGNNLERETFIWARLLSGESIYLPGDGSERVSFIHVQDVARAIEVLLAREHPGQRTYNLAHPQWVTLRDWVLALARQAGVRAHVQHVPVQQLGLEARQFFPFRSLDLTLDVAKLAVETGFAAEFDLDAGLYETFASYEPSALLRMLRSSSVEIEISAVLGATTGGAEGELSTSPRQPSAS